MTIGFYSKSITRIIYIILFTTLLVTSLLTIRHSLNNYKTTVLKQTTLLREEFDINASIFGYILKNNFLPVIADTLSKGSLAQLHPLLTKFKNNISFSSVLENIVILNKEGKAIATSESNISSNVRNLSLSDRHYLQEAKNNPNEIIYGDPVIGKISNKLALPIAIAIKSNTTLAGYIVVSINLNEFSKELLTSNFSNILSNIVFSDNFIGKNTFITNLQSIESLTLKDFILKLLTNSFTPEFHAVTINLITSQQALYFIYDFQKVLNEAFYSIICHSIILLFVFAGVYMLSSMYNKYILEPITVINHNYQALLLKHNQLINSDAIVVPLSELGNLDLLNTLGITLSNKIEEYEEIFKVREEAVEIAINCNVKVLDTIRSKASFSNEIITDMIEDLKNHQNINSTIIFTYLNDLYRHGIEKLEILETYKQIFKYIIAGISERKKELNLEKILLCFNNKDINRLKIKSFIKNNRSPRTLKVYGDPFAQTFISVANYITANYKDSSYTTEVVLNNLEDNFIVDFVLTTKDNTLEYQNKSSSFLEEAKIYALINGGIITKTFGHKSHVITIAYGYI